MGRRRRDRDQSEADAVLKQPLAKLLSPTPPTLPRPIVSPLINKLREIEDRREYHPEKKYRPVRQLSGHPVKSHVIKPAKFKSQLPFGLNFAVPKDTVVCIRRKRRKEVLFAKGKAGGSQKRRHPRRNLNSKIGC